MILTCAECHRRLDLPDPKETTQPLGVCERCGSDDWLFNFESWQTLRLFASTWEHRPVEDRISTLEHAFLDLLSMLQYRPEKKKET